MFTKQETLELLDQSGIPYELAEHVAVFTVAEAHQAGVPFAAFGAKSLFLRDDKKRAYYLVVLPDEKRLTLKEVQACIESRRLSFASERDLADKLGLIPGSVTPLGALNDADHTVEVIVDEEFCRRGRVAVHPCDNTATVLLATDDLIGLLRSRGSAVRVVRFSGATQPAANAEDAERGRTM